TDPDILGAAWPIAAGLDGYGITGNARWLHDASYWAETGLPFIYHWTLPNHPMMLGAAIPVFGSTFYTHTWLGVPVQWCGLVYAYHVFHLARELEKRSRAAERNSKAAMQTESPLPVALKLGPSDWQRVVELITVSAMRQQFAAGPRIGTY